MAKTNWMPGVKKLPVTWAQKLSRYGTTPKTLVLHVAASLGNGRSIHDYFQKSKVAASHFYVDLDGTKYQYQPISAKSGADYGAKYTVSVESQGLGDGKWTNAQVKSLAEIAKWLHKEWGIKLVLGEYSDSRGVVGHRHGVDGNFPSTGVQRGRLQRGGNHPKLSGARGKICPGYDRQAQIEDVVDLAREGDAPAPEKPSTGNKWSGTVSHDGKWGTNVTEGLQRRLREAGYYTGVVDGKIDSQSVTWKDDNPGLTTGWEWVRNADGSRTIKALQKAIGMPVKRQDGKIGPTTIKALQRWLKKNASYTGKIDGEIWKPSDTVVALQKVINSKKGFNR